MGILKQQIGQGGPEEIIRPGWARRDNVDF